MNTIISAQELFEIINQPNVIVLDASQPGDKVGLVPKNPGLQILNARTFDLKNDFSDPNSSLPNTLPTPTDFENACRNLGINNNSIVVIYDNLGIFTSPRAWWMFKSMGFDNVHVLDGGLDSWLSNGYSIERISKKEYPKGDFTAKFSSKNVVDAAVVNTNISTKKYQLIDARGAQRFDGTVEEPRAGMRSGHIPNSLNLPFKTLLKDGKFKSEEERRELFDALNLDDKPLIFSCGSGVTACVVYLASEGILSQEKAVYDGSWTEWGQSDFPISKS
ncbi:sulfurtransferase [Flammeovirga kamogawensis]|uniref:Sulfurtransferase n=1 Tax=Flammeovirga kamogawensis TaxID=373891 RepID=A0ABX8H1Y8_9BACT|nr:sulfurtransferase [Flammeovirga kamogawensis]MBB6463618.1 thiosulfate/3-mercaptopyruvate sulfurtransferase [Flammeovirga kamogawensis]QWG09840.1 sulfurtransferase [Flammeovirga kamogawensis]TRX65347.1 sulfurtransferase [Flammeovirga kamogawensis]